MTHTLGAWRFLLIIIFTILVLEPAHVRAADTSSVAFHLTRSLASSAAMSVPLVLGNNDNTLCGSKEISSSQSITPARRTGRALLESGIIMSIMSIDYWIVYSSFIEDWNFRLTWQDQKKRFFTLEAIRFDTNCFGTNSVHVIQAAGFYNIARTNHLNPFVSTLFCMGTSLFWEYFAEWREVISINDNINSTFGGLALGEPLFQLGRYFSGRTGIVNTILGILSNPVQAGNDLLDGRTRADNQDRSSADADLRVYMGAKSGSFDAGDAAYTQWNIGFETHLLKIPGFGLPGRFNTTLHDTLLSDLCGNFSISAHGVEEFNFFSRAIVYGIAGQNIAVQTDGTVSGWGYFAGLASAYDILKKRSLTTYDSSSNDWFLVPGFVIPLPTKFTDKYSMLHILGPAGRVSYQHNRLKLAFSLDAYVDFDMINAFALNAYSASRPITPLRSTVRNFGYYYGLGYTVNSTLDISWQPFSLKGILTYHFTGSLDGLDELQKTVTNDAHMHDDKLIYGLSLEYRLAGPVSLSLAFEGNNRHGAIGAFTASQTEYKWYYRVNYTF